MKHFKCKIDPQLFSNSLGFDSHFFTNSIHSLSLWFPQSTLLLKCLPILNVYIYIRASVWLFSAAGHRKGCYHFKVVAQVNAPQWCCGLSCNECNCTYIMSISNSVMSTVIFPCFMESSFLTMPISSKIHLFRLPRKPEGLINMDEENVMKSLYSVFSHSLWYFSNSSIIYCLCINSE